MYLFLLLYLGLGGINNDDNIDKMLKLYFHCFKTQLKLGNHYPNKIIAFILKKFRNKLSSD